MSKKTIAELLADAKVLKQKEKALKQEMKIQKQVIATEYADGLSPEAKAKQIAEAESILTDAKEQAYRLREGFKASMKVLKDRVSFAKDILNFVNYKQSASLPKRKQEFIILKDTLTLESIWSIILSLLIFSACPS